MSKIKIFGLGGLNENGKNCYIVEVDEHIFVFDCGIKYASSNLLGIDYIMPDFGYLEKPVIYYQSDRDDFYKGQVYQKGYFDYDTMGFGPCYTEYDKFINGLIKIIENDCKIEKKYLNRIHKTFKFHDTKNCERVYNEIEKLEK